MVVGNYGHNTTRACWWVWPGDLTDCRPTSFVEFTRSLGVFHGGGRGEPSLLKWRRCALCKKISFNQRLAGFFAKLNSQEKIVTCWISCTSSRLSCVN